MNKGILKFVGQEYWPWPQDHIEETRRMGPSIRIAPNSIPVMTTPYPVVFVHPRGSFVVKAEGVDIVDLWSEMRNEGHVPVEANAEDYAVNFQPTLAFVGIFRGLEQDNRKEFNRIVEKYGIEFVPAATHYSYITGVQVVIGDDGTGLDLVDELALTGIEAEPVKVIKIGKEEDDEGAV